jgi:hypothetical protein
MSEPGNGPVVLIGFSLFSRALFLAFLLAASGCYSSKTNNTGGDSHFLRSCEAECGEGLSCICGVCTGVCETDDGCRGLPGDPSCVSPGELGASRQCGPGDPVGKSVCDVSCDDDGDCNALKGASSCVAGFCRESSPDISDGEPEPDAGLPDDAGEASVDAGGASDGQVVILPKPLLMLVIDTSGSMEWKPDCVCTTDACEVCLPICNGDPVTDEKNRWAVLLEELTGTWDSFECTAVDRDGEGFTFDSGYEIPHHRLPVGSVQNADGVLDRHLSDIRFGLATFDSQPTYSGGETLISQSEFDFTSNLASEGSWSYGPYGDNSFPYTREDGSVVGKLNFPNCEEAFVMDTGIRGTQAEQGALMVALDEGEMETVNSAIQTALLDTRPYGGTPIASALDDIIYFFENDYDPDSSVADTPEDRYVLLITDGRPDDDYRAESGCDCKTREECCKAFHKLDSCDSVSDLLTNDEYNPVHYQCAYPTAEQVASTLLNGYDGQGGVVNALYVIGFALPCNDEDPDLPDYDPAHETEPCQVRDRLDSIARVDGGATGAFFADDGPQLRAHIESIISGTSVPTEPGSSSGPFCCALDLLCSRSPTMELAPCLTDPAILAAANAAEESGCKAMIDNNDLRVHMYDCSQPEHSRDCWFEEADALAECL